MRAAPRRKAITPPSNAARSRSRPSGIVHLILKKLVLAGDRFCSTNISTRIRSSMLNPSAHQATPVRVLGTIDCAGGAIGGGDSRTAGGATSDDCGGASASLSGGNGPPIVWLTWIVVPRTDALRHRTIARRHDRFSPGRTRRNHAAGIQGGLGSHEFSEGAPRPGPCAAAAVSVGCRSEEHTSEL